MGKAQSVRAHGAAKSRDRTLVFDVGCRAPGTALSADAREGSLEEGSENLRFNEHLT